MVFFSPRVSLRPKLPSRRKNAPQKGTKIQKDPSRKRKLKEGKSLGEEGRLMGKKKLGGR